MLQLPERALNALFEIRACTDLASIIRMRPYNFKEEKNLVGFKPSPALLGAGSA